MEHIDWVIKHNHLENKPYRNFRGDESVCVVPIQLLDDDGILYYSGSMSLRTLNGSEDAAFDVLNYYTAHSGTTELRFKSPKTGKWETL